MEVASVEREGSRYPIDEKRYENEIVFNLAVRAATGPSNMKANEAAILQSAVHMNSTIVLVGILGFVASFAFSLGPVMWVLFSEIFPNRIRGICMSGMGGVNSFVSWVVQFIFPWQLSYLGNAGTFLAYGIFAGICFALLFRLLPETRGRTLEQLENDLAIQSTRTRQV